MKQGMHYTDVEWIFRGNAALFVLIIMELERNDEKRIKWNCKYPTPIHGPYLISTKMFLEFRKVIQKLIFFGKR